METMSTATLTEDGDCIADGTTTAEAAIRVKGEGITIGVGGDAGSVAGCNKGRRRLRVLDYFSV